MTATSRWFHARPLTQAAGLHLYPANCYSGDSMDASSRQPIQDITDDIKRREASARAKFVHPVHDGVIPDDLPDTLIAAQHALAPAIANMSNDSEATPRQPVEYLQERANHRVALASSIAVVLILSTLVSVTLLNR